MQLPKSYNDLTVKQFQQASLILKEETDLLERHIKLIACVTGREVSWVESHTPAQITEMCKGLDFISIPDLSKTIKKWVVSNKRVYRPIIGAEKLTAGQLIALKYYEEKSNGSQKFLHQQLACIFCDIDKFGRAKKYDAKEHDRIAHDLQYARLGDVYGPLFFYSNVLEKLSPVMEIYLKQANETIQEILPEVMEWAKEQGLKVS